jgi:hypothetical protein
MANLISRLLGTRKSPPRGSANKVLRIGIIQGPRIVDERLVRSGEDVTVGESERNTFVLPPSHLPPRHKLFVARPDGYYLAFDDGMRGKVFTGGAVCPLDQLAARAARHKGSVHWIKLSPSNRGKLQVGDVTVLFQFVQAPPEPRRVVLNFSPLSIGQMDWVFTCFVLFSFVVNISGYLYLESQPPPGKVSIDQIPERIADVWFPNEYMPDPEDIDVDPTGDEPVPVDDEPTPTDDGLADGYPNDDAGGPDEPDEPVDTRTGEEIRQERYEQLRNTGIAAAMMGTRSDNNNGMTALDGLVTPDRLAADLDKALGQSRDIRHASREDFTAGTRQDGRGTDGPRTDTFTDGFTSGPVGDTDRDQREVVSVFELDEPFVDPGVEASSVTAVVKKHKGRIQSVYERHLKGDPELAGTVEVLIQVNPDGSVDQVLVERNTTGNRELGTDIARKIRLWSFPVTGESYEVVYPFNLFPG